MRQPPAQRTAWVFTIELSYRLPTLNSRLHWAERAKVVRAIRETAHIQALAHRHRLAAPVAQGRRRLVLTLLRGPRQKLLDIDNVNGALKPVADSLKDAGWIVDDSPAWVGYTARQEIDRIHGPAVRVEIEEV